MFPFKSVFFRQHQNTYMYTYFNCLLTVSVRAIAQLVIKDSGAEKMKYSIRFGSRFIANKFEVWSLLGINIPYYL